MKKIICCLLSGLLLSLLLSSSVFADTTLIESEIRRNNVTFTDPYWTMPSETGFEITYLTASLEQMKKACIQNQLIDLGFFDRDYETGITNSPLTGSMNRASLTYLYEYLELSNEIAPGIQNIALFNGTSEHINKTDSSGVYLYHDEIVSYISAIVSEYNMDGVALDFEPVSRIDYSAYLSLLISIRNELGNLPIFICGNISIASDLNGNVQKKEAFISFIQEVDVFMSMDYDTGITNKQEYVQYISYHVYNNSLLFKETATHLQYIPLAPGYYEKSEWHDPSVETTTLHSQALQLSIELYDANISGSGVWWWKGAIDSVYEYEAFLDYWVYCE